MGGAAKQMMHPYDDLDMTFSQMSNLIMKISLGDVNSIEKVDGLNIHWYLNENHSPMFARNMTEIKSRGISLNEIRTKMETHPGGAQFLAGINAIAERAKNIAWPGPKQGQHWVNTEIVSSNHPQTIRYDFDALVYHDLVMMNLARNAMVSCSRPYSSYWNSFLRSEFNNPHSWKAFHKLEIKINPSPLDQHVISAMVSIRNLMESYNLEYESTLRDYYMRITQAQCEEVGLSSIHAIQISENVWNSGKHKIQLIKKQLPKQTHSHLDRIGLSKYRQGYQGKCKTQMRRIWDIFGAKVIEPLDSCLIKNSANARQRLDELVRFNIIQAGEIHINTHPHIWEELQGNLDRFESLNVECPVMEGIVIPMYGKIYKLTGAFPSMNRICGAVRYPLGIDFEKEKEKTFANAY